MKLYENIVIGNFLFGLGLRLGKRNPDFIGVNLMQQSPWDRQLADVLLTGASICRVIEFKRKSSKDQKEAAKHAHLVKTLDSTDCDPHFKEISREVHWYIEIEDIKNEESSFRTSAYPYYSLSRSERSIDLPEFLEETVKQINRDPLPFGARMKYRAYLELVMAVNRTASAAYPDAAAPTNGALVITANKDGRLSWIVTDDLGRMFAMKRTQQREIDAGIKPNAPGYTLGG